MNLNGRIRSIEKALRREASRTAAPLVYIVPSWAFPKTKDGVEPPEGSVVMIMSRPGDKQGPAR